MQGKDAVHGVRAAPYLTKAFARRPFNLAESRPPPHPLSRSYGNINKSRRHRHAIKETALQRSSLGAVSWLWPYQCPKGWIILIGGSNPPLASLDGFRSCTLTFTFTFFLCHFIFLARWFNAALAESGFRYSSFEPSRRLWHLSWVSDRALAVCFFFSAFSLC